MIRRLEIENFYSIRETQAVDLEIGRGVPNEEDRFGNLHDGSGLRVPKIVAFLGANASGKSNVLRALAFIRWFLIESQSTPPDATVPVLRFGDGNSDPVRIKVHFEWAADLTVATDTMPTVSKAHYIYEVRVGGGHGQPFAVLSEELRQQPESGKSRRVFSRKENGEVLGSTEFSLTGLSHITSKLRPAVSLTSTIAQFAEHAPTKMLLEWAKRITANILVERTNIDDASMIQYYASRPQLVSDLTKVLKRVDIGIRSVALIQTPMGLQPHFMHFGLTAPLLFLFESEGTRQFFRVYPHFWEALQFGGIAILDELDSSIHPNLLQEILRWFHDPSTNLLQAQLWVSGHSASLLDELRKEEVYFTEKDDLGRTRVYGLRDIEGVRRVDNFYQKYLGGVYGAVPRIG